MDIIKVTLMSILNDNIAAAGDSEQNDVHQRQQILIKYNNDTDQTKSLWRMWLQTSGPEACELAASCLDILPAWLEDEGSSPAVASP